MKYFILAFLAVTLIAGCSNYGKKVSSNHIEVYYKDGVTETQAQNAADMLYRLDNPTGSENAVTKSFQLSNSGDTIICKMVVNEEKANDVPDRSFVIIGNNISDSAFNGKPVNMILTDNKFKPLRTIYYAKLNIAEEENKEFGEKTTSGNIEVYALEGVSMQEAEALAKFMEEEMKPQNIISFQVSKEADGTNTVKMASIKENTTNITEEAVNEVMAKMSEQVFNKAPVIFQLADVSFNPYKTFTYKP